ncbi:dihydrofolate reductase [Oenococcus oeni IOEB_9304]|uniref:Dihydrofolate reductase n=4 Tax=Oenococcus oeni TaxID=1247 RepID=A0AAJ2UB54_OENOE|nr:dihydrofolate reductase [Oenococcus oeni]EAV39444.1 dihydropholate reductase [Oenococcus oeni ATCC BAA-1163]KDE86867.1 dihydrofolate reductase [Oenococcus oeni]KGH59462.1 dihydrofolate reductase [Oenococcus oeni IOEB_9805]KGH65005.1 dihydrofolate reductase [Oenococcus oeni IOEB_C23]KGH75794.1 dihydrofolate reductase [Oenococcus oeni IOEB_9803]
MITSIWAQSKNNVIGRNNRLPWSLPDDLKFFRQETKNKAVVMGRKTYESFGSKALPKRLNIILTSNMDFKSNDPEVKIVHSPIEAVNTAKEQHLPLYVIGGASVYESFMNMADRLLITLVDANIKGDTFAPNFSEKSFSLVSQCHHAQDKKHAYSFDFLTYERKNKSDQV